MRGGEERTKTFSQSLRLHCWKSEAKAGHGTGATMTESWADQNTPTWSQCRIHNMPQKKINNPKACCQGILAGNPLIALIFQSDAGSLSRHTTAEVKGCSAIWSHSFSLQLPISSHSQWKVFQRKIYIAELAPEGFSIWNPEPGRPDPYLNEVIQ